MSSAAAHGGLLTQRLGVRQAITLLAVALGAIMTIASAATAAFGFLLMWVGLAVTLTGSLIVRWGGGFIAALIFMTIGMSLGGNSFSPIASPAPATWQPVARWTGSGIKQTETFAVKSREWRVTWKSASEARSGAGILQIFVYDENGGMVTLAANRQGAGNDVSYVRAAPGRFYLMINSGNVDWDVAVEEQR